MTKATKKPKTQPKLRETSRHRNAFEKWYAADRSCFKTFGEIGVSEQTLYNWCKAFGWHEKADNRDAEAQRMADARAIKDRAQRLEDQRKAGTLLRVRGTQLFNTKGFMFESAADAIRAIKTGVDIERQADGLPNWIVDILNADESTLNKLESVIAGGDKKSSTDDSGAS